MNFLISKLIFVNIQTSNHLKININRIILPYTYKQTEIKLLYSNFSQIDNSFNDIITEKRSSFFYFILLNSVK